MYVQGLGPCAQVFGMLQHGKARCQICRADTWEASYWPVLLLANKPAAVQLDGPQMHASGDVLTRRVQSLRCIDLLNLMFVSGLWLVQL